MHLSRLRLTNFRNYSHVEWEPHPGSNILYGDNGQGKTNLLEAVYYLSTTRSFRTSREKELIYWPAVQEPLVTARLEGEVIRTRHKLHLELALLGRKGEAGAASDASPDHLTGIVQKRIRLNSIPRTASEFVGQVNAVLFSSQDIEVINGAPALRRRYLDDMKTQVDKQYLRTLAAYNRVLEQRNHLLRLIQEDRATADQLDFWDRELVAKGAYLMKERWALVENVQRLARPLHLELTSGCEDLVLKYLPNLEAASQSDDAGKLGLLFGARLKQYQPREIGAGMSLVGPHRDDLSFVVNGINLGIYGSRGQQRTLALSLKLTEARYLLEATGDSPIVLLDDVFSELDAARRFLIMRALPEYGQTISTATELERFEPSFLATAKVFRIHNGTVTPE